MDEFKKLLDILDRLLGPGGCPWDRELTMQSLRTTVLEETCELIEAIDLDDNTHICEELGDVLLNAVYFCKLAEKENRFVMDDVLRHLNEKLIRRHPHVFGDITLQTADEVIDQWNKIKQTEKKRASVLDTIPKELPSLARAQKSLKRMKKAGFTIPEGISPQFKNEDELGELLLQIVANSNKIDPEIALRKRLTHLEHEFKSLEK